MPEPVLEINSTYKTADFLNLWKSKSANINYSEGKTKTILQPYRCFALADFIQLENANEFFDSLRTECRSFKYYKKNNDLYKFKQTNDLSKLKVGLCVRKVMRFFKENVKTWLQELTGIELSDYVALTVSNYEYTDTLLCHDDELDKRRIAFVLYLSDGWQESFGGQLDLFTTDEYNRPVKIVENITPAENMFSFFEVQPNSFHQVAEVLEPGKSRLSINGWFHGASIVRPPTLPETPLPFNSPGFVDYDDVITWINPEYLNPDTQTTIRSTFEDESQIELRNFLQLDKYLAVAEELKSSDITWLPKTPFNKRNYLILDENSREKCPNLLKLLKLMSSEAVFLLVSQLTGLKFHALFEENKNNDDCDGVNDEVSTSSAASVDQVSETVSVKKRIEMNEQSGGTFANWDSAIVPPFYALRGQKDINVDMKKRSHTPCDKNGQQYEGTKRFKANTKEYANYTVDDDELPSSSSACCSKNQNHISSSSIDGEETDKDSTVAKCTVELRKFKHKCYTLMHDVENSNKENEYCLDLQLFFTEHDWKVKYGGYTCYVSKGEDEELLTVVPKNNSLALVYRGDDTLKFVKYINCRANETDFIDLSMTFVENK